MKTKSGGFGRHVRDLRHKINGMTMADVAEALGCSVVYVSDIETGKKNPPDVEKLKKWAKLLQADLSELLLKAAREVNSVDLDLTGKSQSYQKTALLLARAPDVSPEQMEAIEKILLNRKRNAHA